MQLQLVFLFFSSYFNYSTKSGWWMWRLIMWWMIYDLGWVQPTMSKPVLWWVTVESGGLLMNFWPCAVPWLHSLVPKCLWSMHVPIYTPLPPASLSLIVPNRSSLSFFFLPRSIVKALVVPPHGQMHVDRLVLSKQRDQVCIFTHEHDNASWWCSVWSMYELVGMGGT